MPNIGPVELIIILVIALIVIGPGRLPDVGAALGKSIREFRKASTDITEAARDVARRRTAGRADRGRTAAAPHRSRSGRRDAVAAAVRAPTRCARTARARTVGRSAPTSGERPRRPIPRPTPGRRGGPACLITPPADR